MPSDKLFPEARFILGLSSAKWEGYKGSPGVHHWFCSRLQGWLRRLRPSHRKGLQGIQSTPVTALGNPLGP